MRHPASAGLALSLGLALLAWKALILLRGYPAFILPAPELVLQRLIDELFERFGRSTIYDTAVELETQMRVLVGARDLFPNIDYYSGIVYEMLGLPTDLFTPMYAVARVAGWLAHLLEQIANNRMFRPSQVYEGHTDRPYVARADRR